MLITVTNEILTLPVILFAIMVNSILFYLVLFELDFINNFNKSKNKRSSSPKLLISHLKSCV